MTGKISKADVRALTGVREGWPIWEYFSQKSGKALKSTQSLARRGFLKIRHPSSGTSYVTLTKKGAAQIRKR